MTSNLDVYKNDLSRLLLRAGEMLKELLLRYEGDNTGFYNKDDERVFFNASYQEWYSEALAVVAQILPNRMDDFIDQYKSIQKNEITLQHYSIADYLLGLVRTDWDSQEAIIVAISRFKAQIGILQSCQRTFHSSLFNIKKLVQADLFDSELSAAEELRKNGFYRAAGAVAGVVLEKHLKEVMNSHNLKTRKKNLTISVLNDLLKAESVIPLATFRLIQLLGDLRNLCDHDKDKEPSAEEMDDLIKGVKKVMKTVQ